MATATPTKPRADSAPNGNAPPAWKPELRELPVDAIDVGPNIRSAAALDVQELATSIKAHGVLSPIRVEEVGPRDGAARYALVYGQRRLAAAKVAGLATVPALVDAANRSGVNLIVAQLIENLQREDLNALDTAKAYRQLLDAGLTQRALAEQLGIAQPTIANTLRILKAPDEIQAKVAAGELTRSHVEAIAKLPDGEQAEVARRIVEHGLSTRDVELEIDRAAQRASQADRRRDEARALADEAEAALAKKKRATKDAAQLVSYDSDLGEELARRGWTVLDKRPSYYGAPKGCDCPAWTVARSYMGSGPKVTLGAQCVSAEHVKAANNAADEERAKREAEYQAKRQAEAAARLKASEHAAARIRDDADLRARLMLLKLGEDQWDDTVDQFWAAVRSDAADAPDDTALVLELDSAQVTEWLARILGAWAADVDELGLALADPAPPAKASKRKAKA